MQKLDAVVALVGALLLALAVGGAALSGGVGATAPYHVTFPTTSVPLDEGNAAHFEGAYTDAFTFSVDADGVASVHVNATVSFLGNPAGATMRALLRAPNGTEYAGEATFPDAGVGARSATVSIVAPVAPVPAPADVEAVDADAARDAANVTSQEARGEWTLEVGFSSGLAPASSATTSWEAAATVWRAQAEPAPR